MIEALAQLSNLTWYLIAGAVIVFGANIAFGVKVLRSLNADPLDERGPAMPTSLADAAESKPAEGVRTNVAAPRPRRLQAVPPSTEVPTANVPEVAAPPRPVKLNTPLAKDKELAEPVLAAANPLKEEKPADLPAKSETPVPAGALVLGSPSAGAGAPAAPAVPADEAKSPAALPAPEKTLPPLPPVGKPDVVPTTGRKFFETAASSTSPAMPANPVTSRDEAKKGVTLPHLFASAPAADGGRKIPSEPAVGAVPAPKSSADLTVLKGSTPTPITPAPGSEAPKIEQAGEGLLAVSGPAKLAGGPDQPPASAEGADHAKKTLPLATEPAADAGLILIPPAEPKPESAVAKTAEAAIKPAELPAAPAAAKGEETPARPVADKAAETPAVQTPGETAAGKPAPEPVLSPGVADILPASKPPVETKTVKGPRVFLPGKFFSRGNKDKETADTKAAKETADKAAATPAEPAKAEAELPKITSPASAPALIVPPVEEVSVPTGAKQDAPEAKAGAKAEEPKAPGSAAEKPESSAPEPVKPAIEPAAVKLPEKPATEPMPASKTETGPAAKQEETPVPKQTQPAAEEKPAPAIKPAPEKPAAKVEPAPEPEPAKKTPPAPEPKPAAKVEPAAPEPKPVVPTEKKAAELVMAPAAPAKPDALAPTIPLPTQAGPSTAPMAEPLVPVLTPAPALPPAAVLVTAAAEPSVPPEAPITPAPIAVAPPAAPAAAPITQPQFVMPPTDTTTSLPNNGRASAQLTIGFEITSLQLTPFFKLGSVQLKALSNVVSLHLVATQAADSPLAAGISFQIDHVNLDGASHIKSILLKPLGESREITAPVPKLQVDNVAVTGGSAGAPISVTTSNQASTAVQIFGTFTIAAMDFTPAFEIGSLLLEPTSNTVLLRVAPSSRPTALDLPPSFEVAAVQLDDGAQISGVRLTPGGAKQ